MRFVTNKFVPSLWQKILNGELVLTWLFANLSPLLLVLYRNWAAGAP